jgi:hypothetical protein
VNDFGRYATVSWRYSARRRDHRRRLDRRGQPGDLGGANAVERAEILTNLLLFSE